jgi:uncharacterized protein (PEP-CTERM system associated)
MSGRITGTTVMTAPPERELDVRLLPEVAGEVSEHASLSRARWLIRNLSICAIVFGGDFAMAQVSTTPQVSTMPPASTTSSFSDGAAPSLLPYAQSQSPIGLRPPGESVGRGWTITPSASVRGTFSDNANRAPNGSEESDFIFDVYPGLDVRGGGSRLRVDASYTGQASLYANDSNSSRWGNSLRAAATLEAIGKFLYLDASAAISQQYASAFGSRPANPEGDDANRFESRAASLSPYIRGILVGRVSYLFRYNHVWTGSNSALISNSETDQWIGQLQGPLGRRFAWSVDYTRNETEFQNQPLQQEFERYIGTLFYEFDPQLIVSASGGGEYNNYSLTGERFVNYGGGFRWRPTERTLVAGNIGKRFFGTGYVLTFNHRQRMTAFTVDFTRDLATFNQTAFALEAGDTRAALDAALTAQFPDPVQRRVAVDQLIGQLGLPPVLAEQRSFFTQQVLLQKRLNVSLAILGARNTITFVGFWTEQRPVSSGLVSTSVTDDARGLTANRQYGGALNATHRLSPITAVTAIIGRRIADAIPPSSAKSTQDDVVLTLSRQLGQRTTGYVGFRLQFFDSNISTDYTEKAIFGGLAHTF